MLYEVMTGRLPFRGNSLLETLEQVRKQEPLPPSRLQPKLPRDLEIICLKTLQKDPQKRYESTAAMAEDLRRFLAGEPIKARPVSNVERFTRWCRRNPRVAALAGAVFVLLLSAAVGSSIFAYVLSVQKNEIAEKRKAAEESADREIKARQAAEIARAAADDQAEVALDILGNFATQVQSQLTDMLGTRELRQRILQSIAGDLKKLALSSEKAGLSQRTLAATQHQMGNVSRGSGKSKQALTEYEHTRSILSELAKKEPDSDKARGNLALIVTTLGDVASELGDKTKARQYYEQGLGLRKEIVEHPRRKDLTPEEAKRSLAESYDRLAIMPAPPQERESYARKAMELRAALLAKDPKSTELKADLASSKLLVGNALLEQGQVNQAHPFLMDSVRVRDEIAQRSPRSVSAQHNSAVAEETLGNAYLLAKRPDLARTQYLGALAIYQKLQQGEPESLQYLDEVARAYYRVATAQLALNDLKGSDESYAESLKFREACVRVAGRNVFSVAPLIMVQARCGQYEAASKTAGNIERAPEFNKDPDNLFNVACCYALCSAAVTKGKKTAREKEQLRESFIDRAFRALQNAVAHGYQPLFNIETDPDLEPIRNSPQYLALLKELKQSVDNRK
jgi:tetratricopeptide (TPR) repeat protein